MAPNPDDFRHLEEAGSAFLQSKGWRVFRTGQEWSPQLGRWSPDFWVSGGFWADLKIRNPEYRDFLIEWAELDRHSRDFPPTVYLLVTEDPLEVAGYIWADDASERRREIRSDHRGTGSGDPYVQINASHLQEPETLGVVQQSWTWTN